MELMSNQRLSLRLCACVRCVVCAQRETRLMNCHQSPNDANVSNLIRRCHCSSRKYTNSEAFAISVAITILRVRRVHVQMALETSESFLSRLFWMQELNVARNTHSVSFSFASCTFRFLLFIFSSLRCTNCSAQMPPHVPFTTRRIPRTLVTRSRSTTSGHNFT